MRSTGLGFRVGVFRASKADLRVLKEIWESGQGEDSHKIFGLIVDDFTERFLGNNILVAKNLKTKEIIGFSALNIGDSTFGKVGKVGYFSIRKDVRGKGVGSKLFGAVNSVLLKNKVVYASLKSSPDGFFFYPKTNWRLIPEFGGPYQKDFEWYPKRGPKRVGFAKRKLSRPLLGFPQLGTLGSTSAL